MKVESGRDKVESRQSQVESGRVKVESGRDKVESRQSQVESGRLSQGRVR